MQGSVWLQEKLFKAMLLNKTEATKMRGDRANKDFLGHRLEC